MIMQNNYYPFISFLLLLAGSSCYALTRDIPIVPGEPISISYTVSNGRIEFTIVGETTGYVGIGFSETNGMENADIFVAGVSSNGSSYHGDYWVIGQSLAGRLDASQDWVVVNATEEGGRTRVVASRLLNTGDDADLPIEDKHIIIIWSIGPYGDMIVHHQSRGQVYFNLLEGYEDDSSTTTSDPIITTTSTEASATSPAPTPQPGCNCNCNCNCGRDSLYSLRRSSKGKRETEL